MITRLPAALLAAMMLLTPSLPGLTGPGQDETGGPAVDALGDALPAGASARYGHNRLRHAQGVTGLAFDADAGALDSSATRDVDRRWSVVDGRSLPLDPGAAPLPAALAEDFATGRLELRAAPGERAWFSWSLHDGSVRLHLPGGESHAVDLAERNIVDAAFDPSASAVLMVGARITSRSDYGTFVVRLDLATLEPAWEIELVGMVPGQVRVLPAHGERPAQVVVSARDGQARLIDLADGREAVSWQAHAVELSATEPGPPGTLITGAVDGEIAVWDLPAEGAPVDRWRAAAHVGAVSALAASADLGLLASGGRDRRVRLWSLADGAPRADAPRHESRLTRARPLGADGAVVSAAWSGRLGLWNADGTSRGFAQAHAGRITGLQVLADGQLVLSAGQDGELALWSPDAQPVGERVSTDAAVLALAATPDGGHIASSGGDGLVRLWSVRPDPESGAPQLRAEAVVEAGKRAAFALAYLPDGSGLVIASSLVSLVDAATAEARWSVPVGAPVAAADVSSDGTRLALALASRTVLVLDTTSGREVWRWSGHPGRVAALAFSPDGQRVAAAGGDARIRVARVGSDAIQELDGHLEEVAHLSWSEAGLLSASADGTALLWQL